MKNRNIDSAGQCPICGRDMWFGASIDRHHFVPRCRGGKSMEYLHMICHRKIHSVFTEKELEREFNDPEIVKLHPEMVKFILWVYRKPPDFYDRTVTHNRKNKRKRKRK